MADIRIGVFGAWRGNSYISLLKAEPRGELIAVYDKNISEKENDEALKGAVLFRNFDSFLAYEKKRHERRISRY